MWDEEGEGGWEEGEEGATRGRGWRRISSVGLISVERGGAMRKKKEEGGGVWKSKERKGIGNFAKRGGWSW